MTRPLVIIARSAVLFGLVGLAVAGCGRKGDLDRPSTPVEQQNLRKTAAENQKHPAPAPDRKFLLDPLL